MNGGLHIKQELMNQDRHMNREHQEQMQHVIKREILSEYEDLDHQHSDSVAEDLTIASDHTEPNMLDT